MPDAELELSIRRRESSYTVDARFWSPTHDVLPATDVPLQLDLAALRAHRLDPVAYGRVLTTALFADLRLRAAWQQARAVAQQRALRLRIRLDATDPDLHALVWEMLRDPEDDTPLALNERIRLSRYLEGGDFSPLIIPARPALQALIVVANPSDLARYGLTAVDVEAEVSSARAALGDIPTTVIGGEARATLDAVTAALRDGPHLAILVCHGTLVNGQPYLWLEREDGTTDKVAGEAFVQSVAQLATRPLLLVLASCQSAGHGYGDTLVALAPRLVQAGIPGVLAFQGDVAMDTVRRLLPALITELRRDGSIDRALAAARATLRQASDWWLAVLTLRVRDGQLWKRDLPLSSAEQAYQVGGLLSPYLGLRPFTYAERDRFAGRERLITAALAQLTTPGEERVLLFITGASGSGKSSFVQAGLLPALEAHYGARSLTLRHAVMRPSRQPLAALADTLRQLGFPPEGSFAAAAPFTLGIPVGEQPDVAVLVIDQFEEMFTQSEPSQREVLLELLSTLPPFRELRVHLLCTLRSDFLGELAEDNALESFFREQMLLRAMDEGELREAIQRPIHQAYPEKRIESTLLDRLVADAAGEAGYLPLLQVTLEDLWQRGTLTRGAYSSLTDAIGDRAEQVYAFQDYHNTRQRPRSEAEQALLMGLLLDLVEVSLDDETRRDVRRRRALAELTRGEVERTRLVVDLATARLLSTGMELRDRVEVEVVDIIHESLIANWHRLKQAITEQREELQRRTRFEAAFREWVSRGKPNDYLLDGGRLADAQLLAKAEDVALSDAQARNFLTRSLARHDEQRRRQLRRIQFVAAVLSVLLVVAAGAGGWALNQTSIALQEADQRATAEAQALGAAAQAQTAEAQSQARFRVSNSQRLAFAAQSLPLEPALQLAYEAYALHQNTITHSVLYDLVNRQTAQLTVLIGHTLGVTSGVFAPDGKRILTASEDGTAKLWDLDGQP
ncbi:CHAT domain-containing protein, partial [Scytonema tolypothrichoides VB-61278]